MTETVSYKGDLLSKLSKEVRIQTNIIEKVINLIEEGNTVPFIARYRKEVTGGLDEVEIKEITDRWNYLQNIEERKQEVIRLIDEQNKLTPELKQAIKNATKLQEIDDIYRPYRQKRRTRATIAKEKGLEPLAIKIWQGKEVILKEEATQYLSSEKELNSIEDCLKGVNDIIAEYISDKAEFRQYIRKVTFDRGIIQSEIKNDADDEKQVYEMYYDYHEPVSKIVSHRVLALNRGEKEDILRVSIEPPVEHIIEYLNEQVIQQQDEEVKQFLKETITDSYNRLIKPSIEREIRNELKEKSESQAIKVFAENLRRLLLQPPLKGKLVLAIDPAYRTGCKLAVIDETGKLLTTNVIYPTPPNNDIEGASALLQDLFKQYPIQLIAIGNGTASRETEQFIAQFTKDNDLDLAYIIVNEAGASVYSASEIARDEFPNLDTEERSAVSIARRVQDPLAELVKIDPKSIGVGQYQHDVRQSELNQTLKFVVETAVNQVGVNVNTASPSLLSYVSGLNKTVVNNIIKERDAKGKFTNRSELKDIPRLGAKTYEQSIGFLRIIDGNNPLDRTAIHPESYKHTEKLLAMLDCSIEDIGSQKLKEKLKTIDEKDIATTLDIGLPTLKDIILSLSRPERDPRDHFPTPILRKNVMTLEDLKPGMEMEGTVRNVVDFGVFVDIGVQQDGLVHISKLSHKFVKHPLDVVALGDIVTVWVEEVDKDKERISLSMIAKK